jgi:glycosyltransferase involved in cell wall biosynthesis
MKRVLIISQVFPPDPAAVGQYFWDAARELVRRGHAVRVLTSARGYADPSVTYPRRESRDGIEIIRLPLSSLGKRTLLHRVVGQLLFLLQAVVRGWFTPSLGCLLISTSPPMCAIAALAIRLFRRVPIKYWVMDINPDQVVAMGKMQATSLPVKMFNWLNRRMLAAADDIVVLDRFMAERIERKRPVGDKIAVIPPWPMEGELEQVAKSQNPFVDAHKLHDKFVVMYSGNHAITSPVDTLVAAALKLRQHPTLLFMFIGGGHGKQVVDQAIATHQPANLVSLPYQPLEAIKYSLSAADVHVVSLVGESVGITHPCKVYGAMALSRPILYLGPAPSHIAELLASDNIGWQVEHGDVDQAVATLEAMAKLPPHELQAMGDRAKALIDRDLTKQKLCGQFCDIVERNTQLATR